MTTSVRLGLLAVFAMSCGGKEAEREALRSLLTPEPVGENCPFGGLRLALGVDDNRDGKLDSDEVEQVSYICNGADGQNGNDGLPGSDGRDGNDGQSGSDGQPGANGQAGATSLVTVTAVEAGSQCANGGHSIEVGIDDDDDGILDPSEVDSTSYVCHGGDGPSGADGAAGKGALLVITAEPGGPNCTAGGQKIEAGIDDDGDGVLNASEVDAVSYVCHGTDGQDGIDGQVGSAGADGANGADGRNSLVVATAEPQGVNCAAGGQKFESGVDDNGDGVLQPGEVDSTSYVCNGLDAGHCTTSTQTIVAAANVNFQENGSGEWRDNEVRAYQDSGIDMTGWMGFDLAGLPATATIKGLRLFAYAYQLQSNPEIQVWYSTGNDFARATVQEVDLPRTQVVSLAPVSNVTLSAFNEFTIDVAARDFDLDVADGWLSLGFDELNTTQWRFAYFHGPDHASRPYIEVDFCP